MREGLDFIGFGCSMFKGTRKVFRFTKCGKKTKKEFSKFKRQDDGMS